MLGVLFFYFFLRVVLVSLLLISLLYVFAHSCMMIDLLAAGKYTFALYSYLNSAISISRSSIQKSTTNVSPMLDRVLLSLPPQILSSQPLAVFP